LIFSTSAKNVYPMMKLMKAIGWKQHTVHWVIGGSLGQNVKNGTFRAEVINYIDWTLVESNIMKEELESFDVTGVLQVPNFKPIDYFPDISKRNNKHLRFVFISRIMPDKGCDYILQAAKMLNEHGLKEKYEIDFYGKIADDYEDSFNEQIADFSNVQYKHFLNLREHSGYDMLAQYDVMLFPTYWRGEGFAGVFIDTFIAGLPMIASDWAHNTQFLEDGRTALFVPVHDPLALAKKMEECILGKYDLKAMAEQCQKEAEKYNTDNVVTAELLNKIGIL
ncbi:MAG: glycosyltransferase, partial [Prevotella sp.]|nr:glycosyltransferase [Prevotella sp.]